jgi:hypothetical protein
VRREGGNAGIGRAIGGVLQKVRTRGLKC